MRERWWSGHQPDMGCRRGRCGHPAPRGGRTRRPRPGLGPGRRGPVRPRRLAVAAAGRRNRPHAAGRAPGGAGGSGVQPLLLRLCPLPAADRLGRCPAVRHGQQRLTGRTRQVRHRPGRWRTRPAPVEHDVRTHTRCQADTMTERDWRQPFDIAVCARSPTRRARHWPEACGRLRAYQPVRRLAATRPRSAAGRRRSTGVRSRQPARESQYCSTIVLSSS